MGLIKRNFKAVFVLASMGSDRYSAMTRTAVASLRASNPGIRSVILCDDITLKALRQSGDCLTDEADEIVAIDVPPGSLGFRSRFLKTSLRRAIDGAFVFLDSDTFIRDDVSLLGELDCDIACARNHSREVFTEQLWEQDEAIAHTMGWSMSTDYYLNSGVILFNDTAEAFSIGDEWHRLWEESSSSISGYFRDQPAFNAALHIVKPKLAVLPDRFNAQIVPSPEVAFDAAIWHFYSSSKRPASTGFDRLVQDCLDGKPMSPDAIRRYASCRHPWNDEGILEAAIQLAALRSESTLLKTELKRLQSDNRCLQSDNQYLQSDNQRLRCDEAQLKHVLSSRSWRLTRPLRTLEALLKKASKPR